MNNMMEPKIRFKGFEGEWRNLSITEIASLKAGKSFNKHDAIDKPTVGYYPCYGGNGQRGYLPYYNQEGKYNIIGRQGALCGCINVAEGKFYATEHAVIVTPINVSDFEFLHESLIRANINQYATGAAQPGISVTNVNSQLTLNYPIYEEQKAIGKYFTSLDSQISASTSRLTSLKQMKAASLQAMFPQEGETVPKIRFKGFEGEWKKVKLSEILTERHENSTITDSLPQLSFTIADGVIRPEDRKSNKRDFLIKDIDNKRYLVTKVGDIIYNPANVVYGAIHRNSLMNGVVSPIYKIFTTMQDSNFIECAVRRPSFITKLAMCTEGTVTKLKTLKPEAFLNMEVCITPSLEEQKLIGNYFTSLDRQISLQSQRLEKLKQIKSACLDKMFV